MKDKENEIKTLFSVLFSYLQSPNFPREHIFPWLKEKERNPARNLSRFHRPDGSGPNGGWNYGELVALLVVTEATQSPGALGAMGISLSHLLKSLKRFWPWPASPGHCSQAKDHSQSVCEWWLCFAGEESLTA